MPESKQAAVTVGLIDLTLDTFTPQFTIVGRGVFGPGCRDGLAYDASDDTIWASGDVSPTVEHYSTTGIVLSSNAAALGFCNNSGIAVGGAAPLPRQRRLLGDLHGRQGVLAPAFFATFPQRIEHMECDNVNFPGVGAIWSNDAYDNILNAWEIPAGTCTFGGGGGEEGEQVPPYQPHVGCLQRRSGNPPDPSAAGFDTFKGKGDGTYNGVAGASVEFTFTDAGEPGSSDTATMTIKDASNAVVLTVTGTLNSGNHQAHAG